MNGALSSEDVYRRVCKAVLQAQKTLQGKQEKNRSRRVMSNAIFRLEGEKDFQNFAQEELMKDGFTRESADQIWSEEFAKSRLGNRVRKNV